MRACWREHWQSERMMPPSTRCAAPLIAEARSEHSNAISAAISSGVAQR
jgi:hypothetical protein